MNALDKLATLAHYGAMVDALNAAEQAEAKRIYAAQPKVGCNGECELLVAKYDHDGLLIDLHGEYNQHRCEVTAVSLAGRTEDITSLFTGKQLDDFGHYCDRMFAEKKRKDYECHMASLHA
jgi:hypothetical protein